MNDQNLRALLEGQKAMLSQLQLMNSNLEKILALQSKLFDLQKEGVFSSMMAHKQNPVTLGAWMRSQGH